MVKDEKDVVREQQLPGRNFSSGNTTLFEIAESKGKHLGQAQSVPADAIVEDKYKDVLDKAIPVDKIEAAIRRKGEKKTNISLGKLAPIQRGMKMKHKITGKKVVIIETNVDTTHTGEIRHRVCVIGTKNFFKVPEKNLEVLNG